MTLSHKHHFVLCGDGYQRFLGTLFSRECPQVCKLQLLMVLGAPGLWAPDGARALLSTGDPAFCSAHSTLGTMGPPSLHLDGRVGEAAGKRP